MSKLYKIEEEILLDIHKPFTTNYNQLLEEMDIKIIKKENNYLEFDLINVHCSIANALRRILINDIPTVAIDKISIKDNTSVLPDEFLAQRIGLVPIDFLPDNLDFVDDENNENNSLFFVLNVENNTRDVITVLSDDIKWIPQGEQYNKFQNVNFKKGIPLAKLAPKQKIELEMIAEKNIGKVHSKWSPVCPATYRLMPVVEIDDIYDDEAVKLQSLFSPGVIGIRNENGRNKAFVIDPRNESMSREVLRHKEFENRVFLGRKSNHFIFTIESVVLDPVYLFRSAIKILVEKINKLKKDVSEIKNL